MLASEVITDIRQELLEPVPGFWADANLLTWINRAEQDYVGRVRGLEATASASTVAGVPSYELPANWLSAVAVFYNNKIDGVDGWYPLEPTDLQRMSRENPNFLSGATTSRGKPRSYTVWDRRLYLDPPPDVDGDGNVRMFFKAKPVSLALASQSINIDDSLAGAIRAFVLWKAWSQEKEFALADQQHQLYEHFIGQGLRWVKLQALNKRHNIDVASGIPYTSGSGFTF
jgi:hypothetical protein